MKVALFLPSLEGGGAERVNLLLAQGLKERGAEVDLVLAQAQGPYLSAVPKGVRVVDLKAPRVLFSLVPLVAYLRRERPKALFSSLSHANILALWARGLAQVPTQVFVVEHTPLKESRLGTISFRERAAHALLPWVYPKAQGVVAVSKGLAEELVEVFRIPRDKVRMIYNPVVSEGLFRKADVEEEVLSHPWFAPNQPPVLLAVGRLSREKNFSLLLRAFARVRRRVPSRLLILGEGQERGFLEALVGELGLSEDVSLPGFVPNPYPFMRKAAALVLSSRYEALPTVLIEAMALGTPVVATDCPFGPREILEGGRWGQLVAVDDEVGLANAMQEVLENPPPSEERELMRKVALERFGVDRAIQEYWQLLGG
ncbi:glycosyl transferase [Thermus scotoductus]|uniref:Glycosyl transferase n=1 Tax=Thermus scotoductus TaxID=37636 RepID=A0A430UUW8_THESC|nr:glycosyl transferase [Thermus scotoductus]